jgi:glutamate/aspartate transport system substrate-binding protein
MYRIAVLWFTVMCAALSPAASAAEGRLQQIAEKKLIRLAYRSDANPFSFGAASGQPEGYTVDLCKSVVRSLEQQLQTSLSIEWIPVDTQSRFGAISSGAADMECGASTVSLGRMATVDFSSFIFVENTGVMVRANSGIFSVRDLDGKKIAAITGTTNETALTKEIQRRQVRAIVVRVKDRKEGMAAIESGAVDGFASDKLLLIGAVNSAATAYKMLAENLSTEPYAIMLPRGDWEFRLAVNRALSNLYSSAEILDIYIKWFSAIGERPDLLRAAVYIFGTLPE